MNRCRALCKGLLERKSLGGVNVLLSRRSCADEAMISFRLVVTEKVTNDLHFNQSEAAFILSPALFSALHHDKGRALTGR